jgi:hypothetical protein
VNSATIALTNNHANYVAIKWTAGYRRAVHCSEPPLGTIIGCELIRAPRRTQMLSPTYLVVKQAQLDLQLERARKDGNIPAMQRALAEHTYLIRAYYGAAPAKT